MLSCCPEDTENYLTTENAENAENAENCLLTAENAEFLRETARAATHSIAKLC